MRARNSIIPIFIPHLGCPHDCVFCNQKRISGSLLPAGVRDVINAIESGLPHCEQAPEVAFYGGSFTAIPIPEQRRLLGAVQPYLDSGAVSSVRLSTRPDTIDTEILGLLRENRVSTVELGAQSMIDSVLDSCGRGHTAADTVRASAIIRDAGAKLILQMMTGLPGSDRELDIESARRISALKPDGVRIYPTVIIKDTELYNMWRAGEYREHTVDDATDVCAEILDVFENAHIPVIRLGLNPTDDLSGGDAVGGAYHPALGELVKSRRYLLKAEALLTGVKPGASVILGVARQSVSQMVGQHRCNVSSLCRKFALNSLKITEKDVKPGEITLVFVANKEKI